MAANFSVLAFEELIKCTAIKNTGFFLTLSICVCLPVWVMWRSEEGSRFLLSWSFTGLGCAWCGVLGVILGSLAKTANSL